MKKKFISKTPIDIFKLTASILLCFSAGSIGSIFTSSQIDSWYMTLEKPFFNPPNWVFGPVWSILYLLMGISLYLVWTTHTSKKEKRLGMQYFFIQLGVNTLWSIVFFGLESPILALVVIITLIVLIILTIKQYKVVHTFAAWLLYPYLAWVSFATILNAAIVLLQ